MGVCYNLFVAAGADNVRYFLTDLLNCEVLFACDRENVNYKIHKSGE